MKILKNKKIVIFTLLAVAIIAFIFGIGNYFFNYALVRNDNSVSGGNRNVASSTPSSSQEIINKNYKEQSEKVKVWLNNVEQTPFPIVTPDNLSLVATKFNANNKLHKYAIVVHGYTQDKNSVYDIARHYHENGYNVITPDLRAHGESDGIYIGMGWLDRNDLIEWISAIVQEDPQANIVLHGVSMGAATVMMTSGEPLPNNVIAIIEDCGYTSVFDVFSSEIKVRFNLPSFPIINCASLVSKIRAGYGFKEASSIKQVEKSNTPILFIHGTADNFIPVEMCYKLYDTANSVKEKLIIEGAGHAQSRLLEPDIYYNSVFKFINNQIS